MRRRWERKTRGVHVAGASKMPERAATLMGFRGQSAPELCMAGIC